MYSVSLSDEAFTLATTNLKTYGGRRVNVTEIVGPTLIITFVVSNEHFYILNTENGVVNIRLTDPASTLEGQQYIFSQFGRDPATIQSHDLTTATIVPIGNSPLNAVTSVAVTGPVEFVFYNGLWYQFR